MTSLQNLICMFIGIAAEPNTMKSIEYKLYYFRELLNMKETRNFKPKLIPLKLFTLLCTKKNRITVQNFDFTPLFLIKSREKMYIKYFLLTLYVAKF